MKNKLKRNKSKRNIDSHKKTSRKNFTSRNQSIIFQTSRNYTEADQSIDIPIRDYLKIN